MTDNQSDKPIPDDANGNIEAVPFSVGAVLREARVHQGLSVDEVSNRTKFAPRQIEALEADDFAHLFEATFLRGFVRSYARLLQLDPERLLAALPHAPVEPVPQEAPALMEVPFPNAVSERRQNIIWLAAALAVALALALFAWLLGGKPEQQREPETVSSEQSPTVETLPLPDAEPISAVPDAKPETAMHGVEKRDADKKAAEATSAAPQVAPPAVQPPALPVAKPVVKPPVASNASGQGAIRMTFDADSWVEIKDKDGKAVLSQIGQSGTEQSIDGTPPFFVTIGYASGVKLYYKGKQIDLAPYTRSEVSHLTLE